MIAYAVLAAAGLAEGTSFARAYGQMRDEARARRTSLADHVRRSPDTTVKAALFEDSVAMVGLVLAAAGVGLRQLTGSGLWDGAASIGIGVLLVPQALHDPVDSVSRDTENGVDAPAARQVMTASDAMAATASLP